MSHITSPPAGRAAEQGSAGNGLTPYRDRRSAFFRELFAKGVPYEEYLVTGNPRHREKWIEFGKQIKLPPESGKLLQQFRRKINVLVLSGIWCGDCARQGPMLRAIEQGIPVIDGIPLIQFRYLDNKENPELQDELRINGAEKVPVVVALSEDFFEVERFGDRHLSVYRRKAATELGAACDSGLPGSPGGELTEELAEWVRWFERIELLLRLSPMLRRRYGD